MDETKKCPYCAENINKEAIKCKHCGEILDPEIKAARQQPTQKVYHQQTQPKWNPGIAAVLSLVIPGAGQMYKGNIGAGLAWLIFVTAGYFFLIIPGIILHIICIITAASGNPNQ